MSESKDNNPNSYLIDNPTKNAVRLLIAQKCLDPKYPLRTIRAYVKNAVTIQLKKDGVKIEEKE